MDVKVKKSELKQAGRILTIMIVCGFLSVFLALIYFLLTNNMPALMNGVIVVGTIIFTIPFTLIQVIKIIR